MLASFASECSGGCEPPPPTATAHDAALAESLGPVLNCFRRLFRILFDRLGWSEIEIVPVEDREIDAKPGSAIDVAVGIRTVNEVRAARGLGPLAG